MIRLPLRRLRAEIVTGDVPILAFVMPARNLRINITLVCKSRCGVLGQCKIPGRIQTMNALCTALVSQTNGNDKTDKEDSASMLFG